MWTTVTARPRYGPALQADDAALDRDIVAAEPEGDRIAGFSGGDPDPIGPEARGEAADRTGQAGARSARTVEARRRDRDLEAAVRTGGGQRGGGSRIVPSVGDEETQQDRRAGDRLAVRIGDLPAEDDRLARGLLLDPGLLALRDRTARGARHLRSGGRTPGLVGTERRRQSDRHARHRQEEEAGSDADLGEHQRAGDAARQRGDRGGDHALDRRAGQAQRAGGADGRLRQPGRDRHGGEPCGSGHRRRG